MTTGMNCKCGKEISPDEIDYSNGCNEEGEDYYTFEFRCSGCGLEIEGFGYGDVGGSSGTTSIEELIAEVHDKIHE